MSPTITTVAISGTIGVLVGNFMHNIFGGRRSSVGVHGSDGRIKPFWSGVLLFGIVTFLSGMGTAVASSMLIDVFTGAGALGLSLIGVSLLLSLESYSR